MTAISQAMGTKLWDFCANQFLVKCPQDFVRRPSKNCPFETLPDTWPEKMPSSQIEYFSIQNCRLYFKGDSRILIDINIVVPILMMTTSPQLIVWERQGEGSTMCGFIKLWQGGSVVDTDTKTNTEKRWKYRWKLDTEAKDTVVCMDLWQGCIMGCRMGCLFLIYLPLALVSQMMGSAIPLTRVSDMMRGESDVQKCFADLRTVFWFWIWNV